MEEGRCQEAFCRQVAGRFQEWKEGRKNAKSAKGKGKPVFQTRNVSWNVSNKYRLWYGLPEALPQSCPDPVRILSSTFSFSMVSRKRCDGGGGRGRRHVMVCMMVMVREMVRSLVRVRVRVRDV